MNLHMLWAVQMSILFLPNVRICRRSTKRFVLPGRFHITKVEKSQGHRGSMTALKRHWNLLYPDNIVDSTKSVFLIKQKCVRLKWFVRVRGKI